MTLLADSFIGWIVHPDLAPLLERGAWLFLLVVAGCIFAESGLLVGLLLPGDSLLFAAGLVVATQGGRPNIALLIGCCFVAAVAGDQVGYLFGKKVGPALFTRPNSRWFKQENVARSHEFFEHHGPKALVLARFVPIVRTFTPILAGVSLMRYRTFVTFNIVGAAVWSVLATLLGYLLGKRFPGIERALTPVIVLIVAVSLVPVLLEVRKARRQRVDQADATLS